MKSVSFDLRDPHYLAIKHQIVQATGMVYFQDKDDAIIQAITRSLKQGDFNDLRTLSQILAANINQEFDHLVDELTIGETFFFRHQEMFDAMKNLVLPEIFERNKQHKLVRIWSAGCSIGAEPYSIAILIHDLLGDDAKNWKIEIVGTDINRKFLRSALKATFAPWTLRGMSEDLIRRYFEPEGTQWKLKSQFRRHIHFRYYNLITDLEKIPEDFYNLDLVVCRNVMIYFDATTNKKLVEIFHQTLRDEGWLIVGHAENHAETYRRFETVNTNGAVLYHKTAKKEIQPHLKPVFTKAPLMVHIPSPGKTVTLPVKVARSPILQPRPSTTLPIVNPSRGNSVKTPQTSAQSSSKDEILRLCNAGNFTQARWICDELLPQATKDSTIYYLSGLIHAQLGHWDSARSDFKNRLFFQRDCVMSLYHLALLPQPSHQALKFLNQVQKLLSSLSADDIIPLSDGLSCSELKLIIDHQIGQLNKS